MINDDKIYKKHRSVLLKNIKSLRAFIKEKNILKKNKNKESK